MTKCQIHVLILLLFFPCLTTAYQFTNILQYYHPKLKMKIISAEIELPHDKKIALNRDSLEGLRDASLTWSQKEWNNSWHSGKLMKKLQAQQALERGRDQLQTIYYTIHSYKTTPASLDDLSEEWRNTFFENPWHGKSFPQGTQFFFMIPDVKISPGNSPSPMVVELFPYVDDGKHYVLYSNSSVHRVAIDPKLIQKYKLKISPLPADEEKTPEPSLRSYKLMARVAPENDTPLAISLEFNDDKNERIPLDLQKALPGEKDIFEDWANMRLYEWENIASHAPSSALNTWTSLAPSLYGIKEHYQSNNWQEGRETTIFNILGGRAAIRETLQLQSLQVRNDYSPFISIKDLKGVDVNSHDYEKMLQDKKGVPSSDICSPNFLFKKTHAFTAISLIRLFVV